MREMGAALDTNGNPDWVIIHTGIEDRFDWRDRLRILFRGVCRTDTRIYTRELKVEIYAVESHTYCPRIFPRKPSLMGQYAETPE